MTALEPPNSMHLSAAHGWLELGNSTEAAAELARISVELHDHPDVLEARWQIAVRVGHWPEALTVAESICRAAPESPFGWIHRSYCLHELKRTQEAWDCLYPHAQDFPKEWLLCYNLACYACQLGRRDDAQAWLQRALDLGDPQEINQLAAADKDLRPLFREQS
jgi:tetratricopeptide (TPR) repeat protein